MINRDYGFLPKKDWPFIALNFENNTDAILWQDAMTRLFMEFLNIKERDGDFKKPDEKVAK